MYFFSVFCTPTFLVHIYIYIFVFAHLFCATRNPRPKVLIYCKFYRKTGSLCLLLLQILKTFDNFTYCDRCYPQVTNQMITACKTYITNNGTNSIWDQPQQVVADKIKAAIHLGQVLNTVGWVLLYTEAVSVIQRRANDFF